MPHKTLSSVFCNCGGILPNTFSVLSLLYSDPSKNVYILNHREFMLELITTEKISSLGNQFKGTTKNNLCFKCQAGLLLNHPSVTHNVTLGSHFILHPSFLISEMRMMIVPTSQGHCRKMFLGHNVFV